MKVLDSLFSDHSYTSNKKWDWKSEIESEEHTPILDPGFRIPVWSTITVPAMKESDTFEFDTQVNNDDILAAPEEKPPKMSYFLEKKR